MKEHYLQRVVADVQETLLTKLSASDKFGVSEAIIDFLVTNGDLAAATTVDTIEYWEVGAVEAALKGFSADATPNP